MKKVILPLLGVLFFLSSCEIQKRHFLDGYYVNRNHNSIENSGSQSKNNSNKVGELVVVNAVEQTQQAPKVEEQAIVNSYQAISFSKATTKPAKKTAQLFKSKNQAEAAVNPVVKSGNNGIKTENKTNSTGGDKPDQVVLIILAIFIPPLAVYLYEGSWTKRCTVNLILTLLCGLPGMIHALIVVLE
jgi:uncharacterized membrane protein YqaE (UPF0057 family)